MRTAKKPTKSPKFKSIGKKSPKNVGRTSEKAQSTKDFSFATFEERTPNLLAANELGHILELFDSEKWLTSSNINEFKNTAMSYDQLQHMNMKMLAAAFIQDHNYKDISSKNFTDENIIPLFQVISIPPEEINTSNPHYIKHKENLLRYIRYINIKRAEHESLAPESEKAQSQYIYQDD
jgi:hypothetical protein